MIAGVALVILLILPIPSLIWIGGAILAGVGLLYVWYPWYRGSGVLGRGHAVTWNVAFFFGVFGQCPDDSRSLIARSRPIT